MDKSLVDSALKAIDAMIEAELRSPDPLELRSMVEHGVSARRSR